MTRIELYFAFVAAAFAGAAPCQDIHENRHLLGIIPNYRTFPSLDKYQPITSRAKFKIASEDSLDREHSS
jgi:hypothetical protein